MDVLEKALCDELEPVLPYFQRQRLKNLEMLHALMSMDFPTLSADILRCQQRSGKGPVELQAVQYMMLQTHAATAMKQPIS